MWNWKKILKIGLYLLVAIFIILVIFINFMMTRYNSDDAIVSHFQEKGHKMAIEQFEYKNQKIRILKSVREKQEVDDRDDHQMVFIHGAPGSSMDFEYFMLDSILHSQYEVIFIDRLGYGGSDIDRNYSIKEQVDIITAFIINNGYKNISIIGHSYGGPIALHVGVLLKEISRSIVLLAPVMDPEHEIIFWFSPLCKYVPFKWIFPKSFEVASYEKMNHAKELKEIEHHLLHVDFPVYHMHGMTDQLAPPVNIDYLKKIIPSNWLHQNILKEGGHLLPWRNQVEVRSLIEKSAKK